MDYSEIVHGTMGLSGSYDAQSGLEASADELRKSGHFEVVFTNGPHNLIAFNEAKKLQTSFSGSRFEFFDHNNTEFSKRDLSIFKQYIEALKSAKFKRIELVLELEVRSKSATNASELLLENYLRDRKKVEGLLEKPLLDLELSMTYGTKDDSYEVEFSNSSRGPDWLSVTLFRSAQVSADSTGAMCTQILKLLEETTGEFDRVLRKVLP